MKRAYESRTRTLLPRRTYTLLRVDGKSFHTYTRDCDRPYDVGLIADMDAAAKRLCQEVSGARLAFVQSDEISLLLTDFETTQTEAWFDGNVQKVASISASIATAAFNQARLARLEGTGANPAEFEMAVFDSRVWTIPERAEVANYFVWRQQDASRNSLSMTARAHFDQERLHGLTGGELHELLWAEQGVNWNNLPVGFKRGRAVVPDLLEGSAEFIDRRTGHLCVAEGVTRRTWQVVDPPVFTQDREWLLARIPLQET
jgi:tRNA(His) 5'-end guanylyltransferase